MCRASRSRGTTLPNPRPLLRNRRVLVDEVPKHERSNSTDDHGPRRSGATSRTRAEPCAARASRTQLRLAATRVRRVPWRDSGRRVPWGDSGRRVPWRDSGKRVPWRVLVLGAPSPAETLVPRFCDSELVDPAECATRELEAGELAALRIGDADRRGLRGRTRRCEAARSAVHSAAALLRAPAELAPADAAESVARHRHDGRAGLPRSVG